jgi:hypothetical protein
MERTFLFIFSESIIMQYIVYQVAEEQYFLVQKDKLRFDSVLLNALDCFGEWQDIGRKEDPIMAEFEIDGVWHECVVVQVLVGVTKDIALDKLNDVKTLVRVKRKTIQSILEIVPRVRDGHRKSQMPLKVTNLYF